MGDRGRSEIFGVTTDDQLPQTILLHAADGARLQSGRHGSGDCHERVGIDRDRRRTIAGSRTACCRTVRVVTGHRESRGNGAGIATPGRDQARVGCSVENESPAAIDRCIVLHRDRGEIFAGVERQRPRIDRRRRGVAYLIGFEDPQCGSRIDVDRAVGERPISVGVGVGPIQFHDPLVDRG